MHKQESKQKKEARKEERKGPHSPPSSRIVQRHISNQNFEYDHYTVIFVLKTAERLEGETQQ